MEDIIVTYNNKIIDPSPTVSYSTNLNSANDLVVGYTHTIKLNGYCIAISPYPPSDCAAMVSAKQIKDIFNSNGSALVVTYNDGNGPQYVLSFVDVKIKSINFDESSNHWSKYIPYSIELECNHINLSDDQSLTTINQGDENLLVSNNLHSDDIVDITKYKIKSFSENVDFNFDDNIFDQISLEVPSGAYPSGTVIFNNYFTFNYSLSAIGKHDIVIDNNSRKFTMPPWESAKRFVHTRLLQQINQLINKTFLATNEYKLLNDLHINNQNNPTVQYTRYNLFNEVINFNVSESDGSFDVQYTVLLKKSCVNNYPGFINNTTTDIGCSNYALHKVTKKVDRTFTAHEQTNEYVTEITINVDGEIIGLVPGAGVTSLGNLILDKLPIAGGQGAFLTMNSDIVTYTNSKYAYANDLLGRIMTFGTTPNSRFDLTQDFKTVLNINASTLEIAPNTVIKPSTISVTKNPINGTINYSVSYNNKYNCDRNHFAIDISVENPTPVIAEFIIPNNSKINGVIERKQDGTPLCPGHSVIQKLGTQTSKKITVNVKGNIGLDFKRCCLGTPIGQALNDPAFNIGNPNWDLLNPEMNILSISGIIIPSGLVIPEFGPSYILTGKTKKMTFPKGEFDLTLNYTLADVCDVDQGL